MTKITKTIITFIITLTLLAAMSANAFAAIQYANHGTDNDPKIFIVGRFGIGLNTTFSRNDAVNGYIAQYLEATEYSGNAAASSIDGTAQLMYHAIHADECKIYCSDWAVEMGENPVHNQRVHQYADTLRAEFGDELTRAELALIVYRAAKEQGYAGNPNAQTLEISDLNTETREEYRTAIQFVMDNGLMDWPLGEDKIGGLKEDGVTRSKVYYSRLPIPGNFNPNAVVTDQDVATESMYLHYALHGVNVNAFTMDYTEKGLKDSLARACSACSYISIAQKGYLELRATAKQSPIE